MRIFRSFTFGSVATTVWMIAFFGGLLGYLQGLKSYPPYWHNDPLVWELPLVCYVPGLLIAIFFRRKLFSDEPLSLGTKVLGVLILPFALTTVCTSMFIFFNGYLDSSAPNTIRYDVLQKHRYQNDHWLDMQSAQMPPVLNSMTIDEKIYLAVHRGSRVAVDVKDGYFNVPWIVSYRLENSSTSVLNAEVQKSGDVATTGGQKTPTGLEQFRVHNTLELLMVVTMAVFFIGVGSVDIWLQRRAAHYMQAKHPDAWAALGIKSLYTLKFTLFIRNKDYLALNDPNINRMFEFKTLFDNVTGFLFVAILFLLLFLNNHGT